MQEMVVSIDALGNAQHTLKDSFLKLDLGTRRDVDRMSEILHDAETDEFYMQFMDGTNPSPRFLIDHGFTWTAFRYRHTEEFGGNTPSFPTYEDAVAFEIALINAMRLRGTAIPGLSSSCSSAAR